MGTKLNLRLRDRDGTDIPFTSAVSALFSYLPELSSTPVTITRLAHRQGGLRLAVETIVDVSLNGVSRLADSLGIALVPTVDAKGNTTLVPPPGVADDDVPEFDPGKFFFADGATLAEHPDRVERERTILSKLIDAGDRARETLTRLRDSAESNNDWMDLDRLLSAIDAANEPR